MRVGLPGVLLFAVVLLFGGRVGAQVAEETPAAKFFVDVGLVNVAFSVRNRTGALIADLTKDDVAVYEDGVRQSVKYFATEKETPLTIGIVIDFSPSQHGFEDENAYLAVAFLKRILRDQDRVFVAAFGNKIRLISPPGNSLGQLESALQMMREKYDDAPRVGPKVEREGGRPYSMQCTGPPGSSW